MTRLSIPVTIQEEIIFVTFKKIEQLKLTRLFSWSSDDE